jgi:integrase
MNLDLMAASVKPATARQYKIGLDKFILFIHNNQIRANTHTEMDRAMTEFIAHEYSTGGAKSTCVNAIAAVAMMSHGAAFKLALRSLKGWSKIRPSVQRPPMPKAVMIALVELFILREDIEMATLVLLCFYGFLRISEPLAMKWQDISPPSEQSMNGPGGAIRLPQSKTGTNQSIRMSSKLFWRLLAKLRAAAQRTIQLTGEEKVFNLNYHTVTGRLQAALLELGVGSFKLTCHSMRHGGATAHFLETGDIAYVQAQGRWASMKSIRNYVQSGKALLLVVAVPEEVRNRATRFLARVSRTNNL